MTPTDNEAKLVKIYCYVCQQYEKELQYLCQRFSNNSNSEFTDRKVIKAIKKSEKYKSFHYFLITLKVLPLYCTM
jgi:hypothetical protein